MAKTSRLPPTGSLPRPRHPAEAREVLKAEAFPAPDVQEITLSAVEFTSICPRTGQPDFGSVLITYTPDRLCLESKAVKFYLWSYRDEGAFCESAQNNVERNTMAASNHEIGRPRFSKQRHLSAGSGIQRGT